MVNAYGAEGHEHLPYDNHDNYPTQHEMCPESSDDEEYSSKVKSQSTIVMPSDGMEKFKYPLHGQYDDGYYDENEYATCVDDNDSQGVQTACDSHPYYEKDSYCHQSYLNLAADHDAGKLGRYDDSSDQSRRFSYDIAESTSMNGSTQFESHCPEDAES